MKVYGKPFFYLADTAWELLHRLDRKQALEYLDKRASQSLHRNPGSGTGSTRRRYRSKSLRRPAIDRQRPCQACSNSWQQIPKTPGPTTTGTTSSTSSIRPTHEGSTSRCYRPGARWVNNADTLTKAC